MEALRGLSKVVALRPANAALAPTTQSGRIPRAEPARGPTERVCSYYGPFFGINARTWRLDSLRRFVRGPVAVLALGSLLRDARRSGHHAVARAGRNGPGIARAQGGKHSSYRRSLS